MVHKTGRRDGTMERRGGTGQWDRLAVRYGTRRRRCFTVVHCGRTHGMSERQGGGTVGPNSDSDV